MPNLCVVNSCLWADDRKEKKKCSIFKVPKDENLREKWAAAIPGIERLNPHHHVCEKHFSEDCIVRRLLKRGPDSKVLIDIPFKHPRLVDTAIPSIFEGFKPNNETLGGVDVQQVVEVPHAEETDTVESQNLVASENVVDDVTFTEIESPNTDDVPLTFSIAKQTKITIEIFNNTHTVIVPKPWTITESNKGNERELILLLSMKNCKNAPVIGKSIVIDNKRSVRYYVHGELVQLDEQQFMQILNDPKELITTVTEFGDSRVCKGLGEVDIHVAHSKSIYKDNMDIHRSRNCTLVGQKKTCDFCTRLKKSIIQKTRRYARRARCKRLPALSNPFDQKKLAVMRQKINTQRRLKNRKKRKIQELLKSITEKQKELAAIREESFEENCLAFKVPEVQKTALREIITASKVKDSRGSRYTKSWIMLCMLMNIRSPTYYEFLRKNGVLPLPTAKTIRNYYSLIDSKCGFDEKFFKVLKLQFQSKKPLQRHGLLVLDEIRLRKSVGVSSKTLTYTGLTDFGDEKAKATDINDEATYGLVFLFQPLADKCTQPIAVFASKNSVKGEDLAQLVVKAITLLEASGALIHGIIGDGASTNTKMGDILGVNRSLENTKSSFTHPLDSERSVFVFSDVPHLIKNIRNRLFNQKKLRVNENEDYIEWRYIETLYTTDTKHLGSARICPKLSGRHVDPDNTSKMRVRLATQVFSNSVADGLRFYSKQKYDGFSGCEETIKFCKRINDLFDALNRKMPNEGLTPGNEDFKMIQSCLEWLNDWERAKLNGKITKEEFLTAETANGLRLSLQSSMDLCRYLVDKYEFKYLLTGKVNQDNLEKFFGTIRQAAGCNDHPGCATFLQLYKLLSVYSVIKPPMYGNCTVAERKPPEILVSIEDLIKIYGRHESRTSEIVTKLRSKLDELIEYENWEIVEHEDHDYALPETLDCIIYYATGYLCKQILRRYDKCDTCKNAITSHDQQSCSASLLVDVKSRGGLIHPNSHFFRLIRFVESCFAKHATTNDTFDATIDEVLANYEFTFPCIEHASSILSYALFYYIRLRMRHFVYQRNKNTEKSNAKKKKLSKLTTN